MKWSNLHSSFHTASIQLLTPNLQWNASQNRISAVLSLENQRQILVTNQVKNKLLIINILEQTTEELDEWEDP